MVSGGHQVAIKLVDPGIVYILTNAAMPGIVKIGLTRKNDVAQRARQLYTTGVPMPYEVHHAARVADCGKLESVLHKVFGDKRVRKDREFFASDPHLAELIIDLVKIEDQTVSDDEQGITPEQRADIEGAKAGRATRISFSDLGIPIGAVLTFTKDPSITCTVASDGKVWFEGEELTPSRAALNAVHRLGYAWPAVSGSEYWRFAGEKLAAIRTGKKEG